MDESKCTCLSADNHDNNVKDHLLHFLGCIEISDRYAFLNDPEYPLWSNETEYVAKDRMKKKTSEPKNKSESPDQATVEAAKIQTVKKQSAWRSECQSELRRIDFLRRILRDDEDEKHLVEKIEESRKSWENSPVYRSNIENVKKWRRDRNTTKYKAQDKTYEDPDRTIARQDYKPEEDVNVPFIQFEKKPDKYEPVEEPIAREKAIWGSFPDQKTNIENLLYGKGENLLDKERKPERIRYFHIPSNNMLVCPLHFVFHRSANFLMYLVGRGERHLRPSTCNQIN
jgi:hypothetical protein